HHPGEGQAGVDGTDVDDAAPARVQQVGKRGAAGPDRAEQGQVEDPSPLGVVDVQEARTGRRGTQTVDQDVDPAVLVHRVPDERVRSVLGGQVDRDRGDAVALLERFELGSHAPAAADDVHPFAGERVGDGEADALARPGDDGDLVLEPKV